MGTAVPENISSCKGTPSVVAPILVILTAGGDAAMSVMPSPTITILHTRTQYSHGELDIGWVDVVSFPDLTIAGKTQKGGHDHIPVSTS